MRRIDDRWWIVDLSAEGVSLVNHYGRAFARHLINIDLDTLLDRLEAQRR